MWPFCHLCKEYSFYFALLSSLVGIDAIFINFFGASVVIFVLCCDKRADGDRLDGLIRRFLVQMATFPVFLLWWEFNRIFRVSLISGSEFSCSYSRARSLLSLARTRATLALRSCDTRFGENFVWSGGV